MECRGSIIWAATPALRASTLLLLVSAFQIKPHFSHVAPVHSQQTKGLSLSPSRLFSSEPRGTRSSSSSSFLKTFSSTQAQALSVKSPIVSLSACLYFTAVHDWLSGAGGFGGKQCTTSLDLLIHTLPVCVRPSWSCRKIGKNCVGVEVSGWSHTHTTTTWGSLQIYIERAQSVCGDVLWASSDGFCFIELLHETQQFASTAALASIPGSRLHVKKQYVGDRWSFLLNWVVVFVITVHRSNLILHQDDERVSSPLQRWWWIVAFSL